VRDLEKARPACPHAPLCVGCPLLGVPYAEQLRRKESALREALTAFPALRGITPETIVPSPRTVGYRNQAKLVFRHRRSPGGREVLLGVYRPGTHSVLPAERCAVHDPQLRPVLVALRREVEALAIPIFDERSRSGVLRYALARSSLSEKTVHLTLVTAEREVPRLPALVARLRASCPRLGAVSVCVNPTAGNRILSSDMRRVFGPTNLRDRVGPLELESRADAFVQANVAVAAQIYATALRWLAPAPDESALDLYCGVGALTIALGAKLRRVVGIESSETAVACALANARRAGLANVRFVAGRAEDAHAILAREGVTQVDLLIANPPRAGLSPDVRQAIAELAPGRVAYVSCDPRTLARDLDWLSRRGYPTLRLRPFDMLPQTPHLEMLALLGRGDAINDSGGSDPRQSR